MEKLVPIVEQYCTFPMIEKIKLLRLTIFSFLIGNEDLHLKNLSVIRSREKIELSPAYDLVNSSILIRTREELALPLAGKKSRLKRSDIVEYYAIERLALRSDMVDTMLSDFQDRLLPWSHLVRNSFLSDDAKERYQAVIDSRAHRLGF